MASNSDNVLLGIKGKAYIAPVGTSFPADLFAQWSDSWVDLGFIDNNGLVESLSPTRTEIMAWGEETPVVTRVNSRKNVFKLNFLETKAATLGLYYSVATADMVVTGTGDTTFTSFSEPSTTANFTTALGLDVMMDNQVTRICISRADVTNYGDINYKASDSISYQLEFTALSAPDGGSGVLRMIKGDITA